MKRILFLFFILVLALPAHASVTQIIGMSADRGIIPPPSGLCSGSKIFNMVQQGLLTMTEATAVQFFDVGPLEDSFDGNGYFLINNGANTNTLYRIPLNTFTVGGTTVTDTAGNPDGGNSQAASHYNPFTATWTQVGNQIVAPDCNVAANDCLHVRTYPGGVLLVNLRPGFGQRVSGAVNSTVDDTFTYLTYVQSSGVVGVYLGKLNTGAFTVSNVVRTSAATQYVQLANDANFVYGLLSIGTIERFAKSNLAAGPTLFTPGLAGGSSSGITYNAGTNELFVTVASAGASPNFLYKLNAATMAITDTTTLANAPLAAGVLLDAVNAKAYVKTTTGGVGAAGGLYRINMTTMAFEAAFSTLSTANGPNIWRIDVPHQKAYIAFAGGGGSQSQLQQVSLCQ